MKIIKLSAIDSTNSFLKDLAQTSALENFTVIVAEEQTKGRGQMGTQWVSEPYKNLLCSVFYKFEDLQISEQLYLNYAVSLAVYSTLKSYHLPKLSIKWPNDILSAQNKLCGILVENVMQKEYLKAAIIGIGLNVNQEIFPKEIKYVSAIKKITGSEVDRELLLQEVLKNLRSYLEKVVAKNFEELEEEYLKVLYKKNIPTMFKTSENVLFMGMIVGVSTSGKLQIQLEDDCIQEFGVKEITFAN